MSLVRNCLALIPVLVLSGCLEYNEDITVNSDKTGRIQMDIAVLADFFDKDKLKEIKEDLKEAQEQLEKHPEVTHVNFGVKLKNNMYHLMYDIRVKNYEFLSELSRNNVNGLGALGFETMNNSGIRFETLENGNIVFHRTINPDTQQVVRARMTQLGLKSRVTRWLSKQSTKKDEDDLFKGRFATYRFHGPKIINTSNLGQSSRRSVEWKIPYDFSTGYHHEFRAEFSLNGMTWWMVAAAIAVMASGLFWFKSFWARGGLRRLARRSGAM